MKIKDFKIYNNEAEVLFPGYSDLTYVNLDENVFLNRGSVEIYPDFKNDKPEVG